MKKENKLAVYEKALELYIAEEDPLFIGLCYLLTKAILILEHAPVSTDEPIYCHKNYNEVYDDVQTSLRQVNNEMLEISKYKPNYTFLYWFPTETKDKRISILEEAIKTVKDEQESN